MAFWSDAAEGMKDPKRQYRWILVNDHIPSWTLKKVAKPSYTVSETSHNILTTPTGIPVELSGIQFL